MAAFFIGVRFGRGDGTFGELIETVKMSDAPSGFADMDADGNVDILAVRYFSFVGYDVVVFRGNGDGTFVRLLEQQARGGVLAQALASGDVNGDGRLDVVTDLHVFLGRGDGTLNPPVSLGPRNFGRNVNLSDLNDDGYLDAVVPRPLRDFEQQGGVDVLLNRRDGSFTAPVVYPLPATVVRPGPAAVRDLDADGDLDIAVALDQSKVGTANSFDANSVAIYLGNGDGTFGPAQTFRVGSGLESIALEDFDGDAKIDIAVSSRAGGLSVLLGRGDGTFPVQSDFSAGRDPVFLDVGDVNGDGDLDVAVANRDSGSVSVFLGSGDGAFAAPTDYTFERLTLNFVGLRDLNRDDALDLVVTGNALSVLLNRGDGTFGPRTDYSGTGKSVAFDDLDGDGDLDLIATIDGFNVSLGNGDGTFSAYPSVRNLGNVQSAALGDVDGDGDSDAVLKTYNNLVPGVRVVFGKGDGTFDARLNVYPTGSPDGNITLADLDRDGDLDVVTGGSDMISVLLGRGDGTFGSRVDFPVTATGGIVNLKVNVAVGLVNDDNHLDIVSANLNDTVTVLLGGGDGTFASRSDYVVGPQPRFIALGDLNADGGLDFVTVNRGHRFNEILGGSISPRLNLGSGTVASSLPVADAGADRTVVLGTLVGLDGSASHNPRPEIPLEFRWFQTSGPEASLIGATSSTPSFVPTELTTYTFELTVTALGVSDTDRVSVTVVGQPDLVLAQTDDKSLVIPGDPITYVLSISNGGPVPARSVLVTDTLPDHTSFSGAGAGGSHTDGIVRWPAFDLGPGETLTRSVTVEVTDAVPSGVEGITNTASVTDDGTFGPDPTPGNNMASDTNQVIALPDLAVALDDGRERASPGETFSYLLTIGNAGNQGATGVIVRHELPVRSSFVSTSDGGSVTNGVVSWPAFDLEASATVTRSVTVRLDDAWPPGLESLRSTATVMDDGANGLDSRSDNNVAVDTNVVLLPDLSVSQRSEEGVVVAGQTVTYAIEVANVGREISTEIRLSDDLPPESLFVSASDSGVHENGRVLWPPFELSPGGRAFRTVTVEVRDGSVTALTNTVTVGDDGTHGPDPTPENNVAIETDRVSQVSDLAVSLSASPEPVLAGNELTYTVVVDNLGPAEATGVELSDLLPPDVSFSSVTASQGRCQETLPVRCHFQSLAAGERATVTIVVNPTEEGSVTNLVTVVASQVDSDGDNNSAVTTSTVVAWSFTNATARSGLGTPGAKTGGLAWCDFNDDRYLDVLVHTGTETESGRSYLYFNNGDGTFSDVTSTHAAGLIRERGHRSAICADLNGDGYLDFGRNDERRVEIYLNRGPAGNPPFSFGLSAQQLPNQLVNAAPGRMSPEGMGFLDFDHDSDLDLIADNHDFGIDLFQSDGAGRFKHITPAIDSRGLPNSAASGDYLAVADYNLDGWVDVAARKEGQFDLWTNRGDGTFLANTSFDEESSDENKGGVAFCDLDSDGDFDLVWTDHGANQIWRNESGSFQPTGEPGASSGVQLSGEDIDDVACSDVDNDGDLDLFFSASWGPG
jgi:uncharacterized repeat protein (TIGR01451 family)